MSGAAPRAAGQLHPQRRRMVAQQATISSPTASAFEQHALAGAVGARGERGQHVLLGLLSEAGNVLEAPVLGRPAQVVEELTPRWS